MRRGVTFRNGSGSGTRSTSGSTGGPGTAPGRSCSPRCRSRPTPLGKSTGSSRSTPRSRACISTARPSPGTQGAVPNHKNPWSEPPDHGIGRSRGGLTTKLHLVCDGRGRPLSMMITAGNINDTTMMSAVLENIRVPRDGKGRPRTRPDRVLADKGYPSRANRAWLRDRRIAATIPERDDQIAHRRKKPGRPIAFGDKQKERYKGRNVVERCFNRLKQWRGIAMRSDKLARNYRAAVSLAAALIWIKTDLR
ncbi:IS5 family transposase [Agromyces atrinae]|uniref:IS5 family transposase n=1 Tax=Agromyces atrinae TaxID=592376 RepID=UPI003BAEAE15